MAQGDGPLRSAVHSPLHQSTPKGSHTTKSVPLALDSGGNQVKQVVQKLRKRLSLIVGHQESGKTTFTRQVSHLLAVGEERRVVLWWDLRDYDHSRIQFWEQLATLPQISHTVGSPLHKNVMKELQSNGGKKIFLIVDHLTQSSKFLRQLLSKSVIPQCSIILVLQYSHVETVMGDIDDYDLFEIKGIALDNVHEVVRKKAQELKLRGVDRMVDHIRASQELLDMCRDPALVLELLEVYRSNNHQFPKTVTTLISTIVDNRVAKYKQATADDNEIKDHLHCIYRLAYETQKYNTFSRYEFSCLCATIGIPGPGPQIGLGLVQIFTQKNQICCKFIHKTVQAYLAAMYMRTKPIYDQAYLALDFATEVMDKEEYQLMLTYYCGIAHTRDQASTINIEKITLYPLLESIAEKLSLDENLDLTGILIFLNCLYEAQDQSLTRKLLSRRQYALVIPLKNNLAESKLEMLSYCVAHSGINNWKAETTSEHFYLMDYFKMLIADKLSIEMKSNFELIVVGGDTNQLFPVHPKKIQSSKSKSNVYSRTTRELFHRLLQIHSPIKLKSDGSNASYISILACGCLQNEMETREILTLEPITANHWLTVKPKAGKKASNQDENPQTLLHMQTHHNSQHIEFVVMMAPLPQRIKFLMPQTREEIIIELCTNGSPDFLAGGIEDHLGPISEQSFFQETLTQVSSSSEEMVVPRLPLPDQSQSRALTLAPNLTGAPQRHGAQQSCGNQLASPVPDTAYASVTSIERRRGQVPVQSRQQNLSTNGSPFNNTFERSVKQSQSQKQPIMKPGTVFHTMIPEIFIADQTYPLPDESNLIRKGGNGEIFLGVFGGREFVVKKTSYRNREYLIHSKLRHRNIIQLLCLMMGEKHSSQRRKWFCYHFLQKATGDLARLAVDKEENTLKQLKVKYGDNPRKFGLVQGNLKYLLTQILRGLVYLHGLNIVHRDLKASNILLTFHCSCYNPMTCTCTNKCDVQLADFDSSIQLNEDGALPATHASKTDQNQRTFTIVPVGTNGYRPPESSQLIISNDVRCITPCVTTKADIWSFGVLMMRMLNGAYGPASQRELSILTLYYNQDQPAHSNTRVKVKHTEMLKILKLSKLKEDIHWNSRAVDCVDQCLQVDPEKRRTAQDLLHHSFLY